MYLPTPEPLPGGYSHKMQNFHQRLIVLFMVRTSANPKSMAICSSNCSAAARMSKLRSMFLLAAVPKRRQSSHPPATGRYPPPAHWHRLQGRIWHFRRPQPQPGLPECRTTHRATPMLVPPATRSTSPPSARVTRNIPPPGKTGKDPAGNPENYAGGAAIPLHDLSPKFNFAAAQKFGLATGNFA